LEIHDQIHSNSNFESYACKFCAKTFKKIEEVVVHERVHTGEKPLSCGFCEKTFIQLSNKKRHELLHTGEKPHCCQFCVKNFRVQSNMKVHEKKCVLNPKKKLPKNDKLIHKIDLPNSCNAIKKNFTKPEFGPSQTPNLNEEIFPCKLCSGTFRYESHWRKHKVVHNGTKKDENNKKITHKTILKLAEAKENLKNNKLTLENDLPNSREKFSCQFCSGTFRYGSHLRKHEGIHNGVKNLFQVETTKKFTPKPTSNLKSENRQNNLPADKLKIRQNSKNDSIMHSKIEKVPLDIKIEPEPDKDQNLESNQNNSNTDEEKTLKVSLSKGKVRRTVKNLQVTRLGLWRLMYHS
jgi:KRAB domain-containing zinc finger protein